MLYHAIRTTINGSDRYVACLKPVTLMIDSDFADIIMYPANVVINAPFGFSHNCEIDNVWINGEESYVNHLNKFFDDCLTLGISVAVEDMECLV